MQYSPTFNSMNNKVEKALINFKELNNEILSHFFYNNLAEV